MYNSVSKSCETPKVIPTCLFDEIYDSQSNTCVKRCRDSFQVFNSNTQQCDCIQGYHFEDSEGKCVINPITCGPNQRYSKTDNRCVCIDGYVVDGSNNCVPMCDSRQNKIYDPANRRCICMSGFILGSDQISCVSVASTCLSGNHVHYDAVTNSCVCDAGYFLNVSDGRCSPETKRCN